MSVVNVPSLATPLRIGDLDLPNRIIMAPLTRCRAGAGRVPTALMAEYYRQRASAGLILTEATSVDPMGVGYPDTPGIWSEAQVEGWKQVTAAVHDAGGRIFLQLWHVGRISDPVYLNGELPLAPSAVAAEGHVSHIRPKKPFVTPRALETAEIPAIVEAFGKGAQNAKRAGFDGVEVHGANGYLLDQFLYPDSNQRTDNYGGSIVNRARLHLEVTDAVIDVWGADRVGMHIAPRGESHDAEVEYRSEVFGYLARELGRRKIAFLFARESQESPRLGPELKAAFGGPFIANQQLSPEDGTALLAAGEADAISWGNLYIANPDLPERIANGAELNAPNPDTFYGGGKEGYTDYPRQR
ncbi:MAG: alkene reductase [Opitutaceae bacterium]|jgi:2,4-dienoyl-CoA reductase-like NADH-dependent reductase (Old Yellow Enzyme family)|nr:alkene reductase [Opitutaceae bacterium]